MGGKACPESVKVRRVEGAVVIGRRLSDWASNWVRFGP